jgi:ribosomal protein L29
MKLDRATLLDPVFLFLVALIGGTLWLLNPVPDAAALVRPEPLRAEPVRAPVPVVEPPPPSREPGLSALRRKLEAGEFALRRRAAALDADNAEIEELRQKVDALRAELEALEAQRASMHPPNPPAVPASEEAGLTDLVNQRRIQISQLESELANLKLPPPAPPDAKVPRAVRASQKLPVLVDLVGNRIAPVNGEFFHLPRLAISSGLVATRKRPGETIAEARGPHSQFAEFLHKLNSETRYVSCLLNSDSFEAFFAVWDMTIKAGLEIAWEPADTRGGRIQIQRVKLAAKPHARDVVPVPDVMRPGPDAKQPGPGDH